DAGAAVYRDARGRGPADAEVPGLGRERRRVQPCRGVLDACALCGRRIRPRLADVARDAGRAGCGRVPPARPAAGVRAQLLPRRLAAASAHGGAIEPAVQHRHRGMDVPLPGRVAARPAWRRRRPAHCAAAAVALAARTRAAAFQRCGVRGRDRARARPVNATGPGGWRADCRRPDRPGGTGPAIPGARGAPGMNGDDVRVVVLMGVSGSGKTTTARALAETWPAVFLDADDFHSEEARARMASGQPLTDAMRQPWVARIVAELQRRVAAGERVALAFSGLRRRHRD